MFFNISLVDEDDPELPEIVDGTKNRIQPAASTGQRMQTRSSRRGVPEPTINAANLVKTTALKPKTQRRRKRSRTPRKIAAAVPSASKGAAGRTRQHDQQEPRQESGTSTDAIQCPLNSDEPQHPEVRSRKRNLKIEKLVPLSQKTSQSRLLSLAGRVKSPRDISHSFSQMRSDQTQNSIRSLSHTERRNTTYLSADMSLDTVHTSLAAETLRHDTLSETQPMDIDADANDDANPPAPRKRTAADRKRLIGPEAVRGVRKRRKREENTMNSWDYHPFDRKEIFDEGRCRGRWNIWSIVIDAVWFVQVRTFAGRCALLVRVRSIGRTPSSCGNRCT